MDFPTEIRRTYFAAVPHTIFTAILWLMAGFIGEFLSKSTAIVFFIISCTFIFPGGELLRYLMKVKNVLSKENRLPFMFTLLAFTIPASYPLIYLACKGNINYFFPAFTILIGAHYLPFVYGYGMRSFGVLAVILIAQGTISFYFFPNQFTLSAFLTAGLLITFATIHYFKIRKELL